MKDLTASWAVTQRVASPTHWHRWEELPPGPSAFAAIERQLGWPAHTVTVLEEALTLQLPRDCGWDLRGVMATLPAFQTAAEAYKRGVTADPPREALNAPGRGTYKVRFDKSPQFGKGEDDEAGFWVCDEHVVQAWPFLEESVDYVVPNVQEHNKTLAAAAAMVRAWRETSDASSWVVVGGGITIDIAAFAASRAGVPFSSIPTSLLAMVDAAIGGKSAVNMPPFGKNLVGAMSFPRQVTIWPRWLDTLPAREFYAGGSECLKHALISGDRRLIDAVVSALRDGVPRRITRLLPELIAIKAEIVTSDPADLGRRMILNYGHTLAHALEGVAQRFNQSGAILHHGEAVALGMLQAAILANIKGAMSDKDCDFIFNCLSEAKTLLSRDRLQRLLGIDLDPAESWARLERFIGQDKKQSLSDGESSQWILLSAPGQVLIESQGEYRVKATRTETLKAWSELLIAIQDT